MIGLCIKERKGGGEEQRRGNFRNDESVSAWGNNPMKTSHSFVCECVRFMICAIHCLTTKLMDINLLILIT